MIFKSKNTKKKLDKVFKMVEFVKGKLLIGPIIAIIGSMLLLIGGLLAVTNPFIQIIMAVFPTIALSFVMPIILGVLGLVGALMAATGRKVGNYVVIISGLVAVIGMFIPVFFIFPLVMSLFYVDPILILIGGILGVAIKE